MGIERNIPFKVVVSLCVERLLCGVVLVVVVDGEMFTFPCGLRLSNFSSSSPSSTKTFFLGSYESSSTKLLLQQTLLFFNKC